MLIALFAILQMMGYMQLIWLFIKIAKKSKIKRVNSNDNYCNTLFKL